MTVRTRIAPSPTGAPHIGTAYIALFNYAFAKSCGGSFVLRIEDTDQARSTPESEREILDALRWVGLPWDEGPDVGGAHGPYRQSERLELYAEHARKLVESQQAYPCFCSSERLQEVRDRQAAEKADFIGYDGHCRDLPPDEAAARIATGETHVIRLRVQDEGECVFTDRLRGEVTIPWRMVDDQILVKADGFPTYHLANVVDDHLMGITHVLRGEEWISSAPKHMRLYEAFGWEPPELVHLPLLRNPDKSKLSKRKNPTSILYYQRAGFLPEALVNFLGLMAYSPADGEEVFSLEKMVETFDLDRVSLGGPIFDVQKLRDFNGRYIRALEPTALMDRMRGWILNDDTWQEALNLAQPRLTQLTDFVPLAAFLFADNLDYDPAQLVPEGEEDAGTAKLLTTVQWEIERGGAWTAEGIRELLERVAEQGGEKLKTLLRPFYIVFTGTRVSLPLFDSMALLGRDLCLRRLHYALEALNSLGYGLRGKPLKRFTKEYERTYGRRS